MTKLERTLIEVRVINFLHWASTQKRSVMCQLKDTGWDPEVKVVNMLKEYMDQLEASDEGKT